MKEKIHDTWRVARRFTAPLFIASLCACADPGGGAATDGAGHRPLDEVDASVESATPFSEKQLLDAKAEAHQLEPGSAAELELELAMDGLSYPLADDDPLAQLDATDWDVSVEAIGHTKAVLGDDSRTAVPSPTKAPYSPVAQLLITFKKADGTKRTARCTGTLVRADAVLTAAHCLFSTTDGWAYAVRVIPAMTATTKPFGESSGRRLFVPAEYRDPSQTKRGQFDFGIIRTWARLGDRAGLRRLGVHPSPAPQTVRIIGYAGDRPNTMLQATGLTARTSGTQVLHGVDAFAGTSGAGILGTSGTWTNTAFAVHSGEATVAGYNVGVLLTSAILARLTSWSDQAL